MFYKLNFFSLLGAVALFFLPWLELSCSSQKSAERLVIGTQTGLQIALGKATQSQQLENISNPFRDLNEPRETKSKQPNTTDKLDASLLVAAAGALMALALVCALLGVAGNRGLGGLSSLLAAAALGCIVIQWQQGFPIDAKLNAPAGATAGANGAAAADALLGGMMKSVVQTNPQPAFYGTLALLGFSTLLMINAGLDRLRRSGGN
jgi:hypothetical protein